MKIAMYWHNGRSLGHTAESAKIAHALVDDWDEASIVGVTGAYRGTDLLPQAMDILRLPTFTNYDRTTGWGTTNKLGVSNARLFEIRARLAETFLLEYDPDLLLVNHIPAGAEQELEGALKARSPEGNVLTLRGFLFDRVKTGREYFDPVPAAWIAEKFGTITVHMPSDIFRLEDHYDVPDVLLDRIHYTGYLADPDDRPVAPLREKLGWDADETVMVCAMGGGQGGIDIWRRILDAIAVNSSSLDRIVIVNGPYLEHESFQELIAAAPDSVRTEVLAYAPNMGDLLRAADIVISAAGGNAIAEVLAAGANAVLVPRQVRESEQLLHSSLVAKRGWARMATLPEVEDGALESLCADAIHEPLRPDCGEFLGGARRYAGILAGITRESK